MAARRIRPGLGTGIILSILAAVSVFWALPRWQLTYYLEVIDQDPLLAQVGLRKIGVGEVLPRLAPEVAERFDVRPITPGDLQRFRIIEQLVRDDPAAAIALARQATTGDPVRHMLGTLAAGELERDELWDLAAHWAGRSSPWASEIVFWICDSPGDDLRQEAMRHHARGPADMQLAAGLVLIYARLCEPPHDAVREVAERTRPGSEWHDRAVRCLLNDIQIADLPLLERCMLEDDEALRLRILWALRYMTSMERVPLLLRVVDGTAGSFRRDCFSLATEIMTDAAEDEVSTPSDALLQAFDRFLDDGDPAIRSDALMLLHPDRMLDQETARRVTRELGARDLADHGLFYFLEETRLREVAMELVAAPEEGDHERFRVVALSVFPPLPGSTVLDLISLAHPGNLDTAQEALLRLEPHDQRAVAPGLVHLLARECERVRTAGLEALGARGVVESLAAGVRAELVAMLQEVTDPERPGNIAIYVQEDLRQAVARIAGTLGGEPARGILQALIAITDGEERAGYRAALDR